MANQRGTNNEFSLSSSSSSSSIGAAAAGNNDDSKDSTMPECVQSIEKSRRNNSRTIGDSGSMSTGGDWSRREENPFSFKHFLHTSKQDAPNNYNMSGARPKMYSSSVRRTPDKPQTVDTVYSRNPTELPDFVQDHLVIEQCYLNKNTASEPSCSNSAAVGGCQASAPLGDIDNLPDFTLTSIDQCQSSRTRSHCHKDERSKSPSASSPPLAIDLPFDLTGGLETKRLDHYGTHGNVNIECKSGSFGGTRPNHLPIRPVQVLPFDLPPAANLESRLLNDVTVTTSASIMTTTTATTTNNRGSSSIETNINKSLPDFLNDAGPIRNTRIIGAPPNVESSSCLGNFSSDHSDVSLSLENARLRDELKITRRQVAEGTRMIEALRTELISRRQKENDETAHLEKAIEQVESNLKQSTKRATSAENTVSILKQRVKNLTAEVAMLRAENQHLGGLTGAGCAATSDYRTTSTDRRIKQLSEELRAAASSAEGSLRQLMSGVNNLKVLASALENVERIDEREKDFQLDFEKEDAAGPAL